MAERNFALEKAEIEKVVITEKNGTTNTLTHDGNDIWYVNGDRISLNQKMLVVEALTDIRINSIPPKGAYKQIMKTFGEIGILVRVFGKENKLLRSYYVGGVPQGERGTYYLMEGYKQPYLMEMPGMEGSTRGRFTKKPTDWLDRAMFRYSEKDVAKISVEYHRSKKDSYIIEKNKNDYTVKPFHSYTPAIKTDPNERLLETYFNNFYVGFFTEAYENENRLRDSIVNKVDPWCTLTVENTVGEVNKLEFHTVNEIYEEDNVRSYGPDVDHRIERYLVNINDNEKFMLTQQLLAKKFLWGYEWFFR